jgi:hypothetical protein
MMAGTLKTGSTDASNGKIIVNHKNINLWNLAGQPVGYWIESDFILDSQGAPDQTFALIKHTDFNEALGYRAQIGSAARDIYQNCYKPSAGPGCSPGANMPSCCNGSPAAILTSDGNCP